MPPLRAWIYTIVSGSTVIGLGALGLKYLTPTDEQFINSLSPELREKYEREKDLRVEFERYMAKEMEEHRDNPAFFKGQRAMRTFDKEVAKTVYKNMEQDKIDIEESAERKKLRELAQQERR